MTKRRILNENAPVAEAGGPTREPIRLLDCGSSCLPKWLDEIETRMTNRLARRALESFRREPTTIVSVGEWANRVGVSREHLTRSISPVINPHALILATRLAMAMEALAAQENLRAGEALDVMGYSSRAHAFMVFKSQTGLTPSEWWRAHHSRTSPAKACVSERCPLLTAMLDRSHERPTGMDSARAKRNRAPKVREEEAVLV